MTKHDTIYQLTIEDIATVYDEEHGEDGAFDALPKEEKEKLIRGATRAVESFFGEHWTEVIKTGLEEL